MDEYITTWYGEPVENLSKEELIEALNTMMKELASHRTPEAMRANSLGAVEMLKRGERRYG